MRLGSILLLIAAGFGGLIAHYFIFISAVGANGSAVFEIVAAKAIFALVCGYLSERALRMSGAERLTLLGAYELVPLLMPVLAAKAGWLLFILPDLAAGRVGIALAKKIDKGLTPARS
jgi:hypothetical protein